MDCSNIKEGIKIDKNTIFVKKEAQYVNNEVLIYNKLGHNPYTSQILSYHRCINDITFSVISYKLEIPYERYKNNFKYNAELSFYMSMYFTTIFDAYQFLLSKHIIHKDLKPQNVLLKMNKTGFILTDFDRSIVIIDTESELLYLPFIKDDFIRFLSLFYTEIILLQLQSTKSNSVAIVEFAHIFKESIQVIFKKSINEYTITTFMQFIKKRLDYIIRNIPILQEGGKKLNKKNIYNSITTYGNHYTSSPINKTRTQLQFYPTSRRKTTRYLYRKQRNTRKSI